MGQILGTNVAAPIVPFSTDDIFASHEAKWGKGGYRTVATIAERDAIVELRRENLMLVAVEDSSSSGTGGNAVIYQLYLDNPDNPSSDGDLLNNNNWVPLEFGGSGDDWILPPPPSSFYPGEPGDRSYDDDFVYICIQPNLWKRISMDYFVFNSSTSGFESFGLVLGNIPIFDGEGSWDFDVVVKNIFSSGTKGLAVVYTDNSTSFLNVLVGSEPVDITYQTDLDDAVESPGWTIPNGLTVGDVRGQTFSEFIDNYLFPTVFSTLTTNRSATLTFTPSGGNVEVGTLLDPTLTATFNRGLITGGNGATTPLVGLPNTYTFTGLGISTSVIVSSSSTTEQIVTDGSNFVATPAGFGNNNWSVQVDYDAGVTPYYDSKGNLDTTLDGSRVSGSISDSSPNYTGRYYAFYDTGSIPVNSAQVRAASNRTFLNSGNNGSFNITIPALTSDVFFAVPNDGQTATVLYVESSNADVTGSFSVSTFNVNDANGSPVSYDIYSTSIGGGGYPSEATYSVTIS
jgi:hypothetical protein